MLTQKNDMQIFSMFLFEINHAIQEKETHGPQNTTNFSEQEAKQLPLTRERLGFNAAKWEVTMNAE